MIKRIADRIVTSRIGMGVSHWSKKAFLPGFEGLHLNEVILFFIRGIRKGAIVTRARAVSFTLFLAMLPTLLFLISLIPYIPIENFQDELLLRFKVLIPEPVYVLMEATLHDLIDRKYSTILSIGFFLTVYYASNSVNSILTSFNKSYHLKVQRHPIKQRLLALFLIFVLTLLMVMAISLMIFSDTFFGWLFQHHYAEGHLMYFVLIIAKWTLIVLLFQLAISLLYNFGDTQRTGWKIISAGSTLATVLSITVSWGFAWYVSHFSSYNKLYGSLGTVIILLLLIYFNALILLIGFELNTGISTAKRQKRML